MPQLDVANLWQYNLRKGSSSHPRDGACLFDAGMWLVYGKIGDNPPCSCPIIRSYAISLNDRFSDEKRQLLKPFILRVVGNRDPEAEAKRLHYIVLETARQLVGLDLPDDANFNKIADAADAAADAARAAARAADYAAARAAAYAADAAARAADYAAARAAAYAADAAARAADYAAARAADYAAARAAAYAADAAARAAYAVDAAAINILDGVLRIGKQSPEYDEIAVVKAIKEFDFARSSVLA